MKFKQIMQKLKEGHKVRRRKWEKDSFWELAEGDEMVICHTGAPARIHYNHLLAKDWEVYDSMNYETIVKIAENINDMITMINKYIEDVGELFIELKGGKNE